jgi:excisionase family DNA binding protein
MEATVERGAPDKLYTLQQAAEYLRVSPRQVLRWCKEKKIDHYRPSERRLLISASAIESFLAEVKVEQKRKVQRAHRQ